MAEMIPRISKHFGFSLKHGFSYSDEFFVFVFICCLAVPVCVHIVDY